MNSTDHLLPKAEEHKLLEEHARSTQEAEKHPHHIAPWKVITVLVLLALVVGAIALWGYLPRREREKAAAQAAHEEATAIPAVTVTRVRQAPSDTEVLLPGSLSPLTESSVYARAAGYVRKRYVDIGDRVRQGQLLAEIETPDLDQQVAQARAAVAQAQQQLGQTRAAYAQSEAQRDLAKVTNERYQNLVTKGAIARQDADTQATNYRTSVALVEAQAANIRAAEENVRAAQASLERVIALQEFQRVRAPFTGVITARNIDVGSLISPAGAGQGVSQTQQGSNANTGGYELFRVAQLETLRVYVNVPQANAPSIQVGLPADVIVTEFPGRKFTGKVTRTASSLDPTARTMLTEVQIPNPDRKLYSGMYAQIRFRNHREHPPYLVPGDAVVVGANGMHVAVLEDNQDGPQGSKRIHLLTVTLGRDYGAETEVIQGLQGWETVVVNPGDEVSENAVVKPEASGETKGQTNTRKPGSPSENRPGGISSQSPAKTTQDKSGAMTK